MTQDFDGDAYLTTISLTENTAGTYVYRFWAVDGKGASSADNDIYWTLTLKVVDEAVWNTSFYVGRDMFYSSNGSNLPTIKLYKTAGVNNDKKSAEYNYDYVGTFQKDGDTVLVYDPIDYIITGDAESGWKIQETADGPEYTLENYEPIEFTDSTFGEDPENGTESGSDVNGYNMFYASVLNGWYSYRGYGYSAETGNYTYKLGGMKLKIPADANVDGNAGGGTNIYLRTSPIYTTSKKTDNTYFTADEYHAVVTCPIMECNAQPGTPYKSGNYEYYPFLLYAGGNSCLYNNYVYPDIPGYIFTQSINATITTGTSVNNRSLQINTAIGLNVTVPEDAEFGIYFQYNNFNSGEIEPEAEPVNNGDGTKTLSYNISKGNGNYTWRLEDPSGEYVTKAGYLSSSNSEMDLSFTFDESDSTAKKSHDFSKLGTATIKRDEADIQVGLDPTGYLAVGEDATKRVRAYRHWEIINSDSGNIMIEPDFHWSLLSGTADIDTVDGGNASENWADIDPDGTAIIAVNYDAINVFMNNAANDYSSHGGLFPATSTNRSGVIVMSDTEKGSAIAHIKYNSDGSDQTRSADWDYNYDTWYYTTEDENPIMDFTVTGDELSKVQYALVTSGKTLKSKMTSWKTLTSDEDGNYEIDLNGFRDANANGGTVIIRMTDSTGVSYCLARAAEVEVFADNATKPGEAIEPGDEVTISFDGLYRALNKQSGIFNPLTFVPRYSSGDTEVSGTVGQYQMMDTAKITLKVPEDIEFPEGENETSYEFTNGYVYGQMFSAANPFRFVYEMTDTGVGTNFNAVQVKLCFQHLADVSVKVVKHASVGLKLQVTDGETALEGATVTVKDPAGNELEANDGKYEDLSFGTYSYVVEKEGYVKATGKFKVSRADELDEDGCVTKTIEMTALGEGEWDGETKTEPAADEDGVYQIGTAEELAWFADAVNNGVGAAYNAKLIEDIDLSGRDWTPIGISSSKVYKGSFDGDNHMVKGLSIDVTAENQAGAQYKGLFGCVKGTSSARASIKNLKVGGSVHVTCPSSVSNGYIGGVCGYANYVDFENIISDIDVSIEAKLGNWVGVGGICGYGSYASFTKCLNAGNVTGQMDVGGIAGFFGNDEMDQCANYGNIKADGNYTGGVTGITSSNKNYPATIRNCYNVGDVTSSGTNVGGVAANVAAYAVAENLFNMGTVKGSGTYEGAVTGNVTNNSTVTNVYSTEQGDSPLFGFIGTTNVTAEGEFVTARELSSAKFLAALNGEGNAFVASDNNPVLAWFEDWTAEQECKHKLKKHKANVETCVDDGNIEYWSCSLCGKFFSDANAETEVSEADIIVKAHGLREIPAKEPSCTEDGHNAYFKCRDKSCGKLYKDAAGEEPTTLEAETIPAVGHALVKTDAQPFEGIAAYWTCDNCGEMFADAEGTQEIHAPQTVTPISMDAQYDEEGNLTSGVALEQDVFTFDGSEKTPAVIIKDTKGNIVPETNYDVVYGADSASIGTHTATVTFKENYEGTVTLEYTVNPVGTKIKSIKAGKKKLTVKWTKVKKEITGYEIQYSLDENFDNAKTVTVKKANKAKVKIKKLSKKKKYFVKIRTYKTVDGQQYYSDWSPIKAKKTK
ncbi:MAG: fibronectin type III domain-containing protein [Bacillota bacterium]|nr:fibronectin type III domain-containing protein [Bacillota bacterium]